jgi:aminodeoxyfutalosine synthase
MSLIDLESIRDKVARRERLTYDDGLALYAHPDWVGLGQLAHEERTRRHADRAYFNHNMRIEVTNVCVASCRFCAFAKLSEGAPGAHTMTLQQAWRELEERMGDPPGELHIVNGLHPDLPFSFYEDLLRGFKRIKPDIVLKCFTAIEIHFFTTIFGMSHQKVLERLRAAGLDALPGGGGEIFHPDVRRRIAPDKADAHEYLAVHEAAHRLGMKTNVTMLYGHIETFEHRVDHLMRIRDQQDRSGGFEAFIPLAFHPAHNDLERLPGPTGVDDLRTIAVSRLLLDNVDHIKAYWVSATPKVAQIALCFGADDLDGTTVHETIYSAAGSTSPAGLGREDMVRLIREAGLRPVERDTHYGVLREYPRAEVPEAALKVRERKRLRVVS